MWRQPWIVMMSGSIAFLDRFSYAVCEQTPRLQGNELSRRSVPLAREISSDILAPERGRGRPWRPHVRFSDCLDEMPVRYMGAHAVSNLCEVQPSLDEVEPCCPLAAAGTRLTRKSESHQGRTGSGQLPVLTVPDSREG